MRVCGATLYKRLGTEGVDNESNRYKHFKKLGLTSSLLFRYFFFIINQCVMMISMVMKVKGDVISVIITSIKTQWYLRSVNKTIFLNCFELCDRCLLLC